MVEIDSLFRRFRRKLIPSLACSGAFDETALRLIPRFPLGNRLWWSRSWFRWSSPPSVTKSQILRIYLDLRSIPLDLRSICPFVASKYCEATMHPVYLTKITVSTKNFPRSEGRKCGVKGLVQWRGLMIWSRSIACSGAFDETALRLIPSFPLGNGLWWSTSCFRWSSPPIGKNSSPSQGGRGFPHNDDDGSVKEARNGRQ